MAGQPRTPQYLIMVQGCACICLAVGLCVAGLSGRARVCVKPVFSGMCLCAGPTLQGCVGPVCFGSGVEGGGGAWFRLI